MSTLQLMLLWSILAALPVTSHPADIGQIAVVEHDGSPYERFVDGEPNEAPRSVAARRFYSTHRDAYDFLIVFPAFTYDLSTGSDGAEMLGLHNSVRNAVAGIGQPVVDRGTRYGSPARLKGYVDINSLVPGVVGGPFEAGLGAIAHEVAHQWSGQARFFDPVTGAASSELLGQDQVHWSFFLDSDGSVLYGSDWQASAIGSFTAAESLRRYSSLDLYLMGFVAPSEVAPLTLIRPAASTGHAATDLPSGDGTTVEGTAETVTIEQIIQAMGARSPASSSAQTVFRAAFVLLLGPGQTATAGQLAFVDALRREWANRFFFMTQGRAVMETDLVEVPPATATSSPSVQLGLSYLLAVQKADGSWGDSSSTTVRETQVSLEALDTLRTDVRVPTAMAQGVAFLDSVQALDVDTSARQRIGLLVGNPGLQPVAGLPHDLSYANLDGGMGLASGYQSSVVDTLLAVRAALPLGAGALVSTVDFLQRMQNGDGGWPWFPGGASDLTVTGMVLELFSRLDRTEALTSAPGSAQAFVASHRGSDGHYRDLFVDELATSGAVLALDAWGQLQGGDARATSEALLALQQADGSWSGSVHETALALMALRRLSVPNLVVRPVDIAVSAPSATEGASVLASVLVHNIGHADASQVSVRAFDSNGLPFGPATVIPVLEAGAMTIANLSLDTTGHGGSTQVFVVIDPDGALDETRRDDNRAAVTLAVTPRPSEPDLFVAAGSLLADPSSISRAGTSVTVTARVGNLGRTDVGAATVVLLAGGATIASTSSAFPAANDRVVSLTGLVPAGGGAATLTVVVDPENALVEPRKDNNSAQTTLTVVPTVDLRVSQVTATPNPVDQGRDAMIQFQVENRGTADARLTNAIITLLDASGMALETLAGAPLAVPAGGAIVGRSTWRANSAAVATVRAEMSYAGDLDPSDNAGSVGLTANPSGSPNLLVAGSLSVTPSPLLEGQMATVSGVVRNSGNSAAGAFLVDLWVGDPSAGGARVAQTTIPGIPAKGEAGISLPFTVSVAGPVTLVVALDSGEQVAEFDESDNRAVLRVESRSRPDLAITDGDIQPASLLPVEGTQVPVKVEVANVGDQEASPALVELYQGAPETGGVLIGSLTIGGIAGRARTSASFNWSTAGVAGAVTLVAIVNRDRSTPEANYENDRARRSVMIQSGNLALSEPYFSPNGDGVKDTTELFYRLPTPSTATVTVTDRRGRQVRKLSGGSSAAASGSVIWDGRADDGALVRDGTFRLTVRVGDGEEISTIEAVVDTNRAGIMDVGREWLAEASPYEDFRRILPAGATGFALIPAGAAPDESALVYHFRSYREAQWSLVDLDCGFFRVPAGGGEPSRLSPPGWTNADQCRVYQATATSDGRNIIYAAYDSSYGANAIRRFEIDTQTVTELYRGGGVESIEPGLNAQTVLFDDYQQIQEVDLNGQGRHVVGPSRYLYYPQTSPDRQQIAFLAEVGGSRELTLSTLSGVGVRALVVPERHACLEWGHVGELVLCRRVDPIPTPAPAGAQVLPVGVELRAFTWLDPSRIAYVADGVWVLDLSTGKAERRFPAEAVPFPMWRLWADPAGEHLALVNEYGGGPSEIWSVAVDGEEAPSPFYELSSGGGIRDLAFSAGGTLLQALGGYYDYESNRSIYHLGNLGVRVTGSRKPASTSFVFHGSATDLNFESWELTAKPMSSNGDPVVVARGTTAVVDGEVAEWTPSRAGTWEATLTARDRAGNTRSASTLATWAEVPSIANLRVTPQYVSPNGDGRQDEAVISYSVQEPVSTELVVRNEAGAAVRTISVTHLQTGTMSLSWNGRDDGGAPLPDGKYSVTLGDGRGEVTLDGTVPDATLRVAPSLDDALQFATLFYKYTTHRVAEKEYPADCGPSIGLTRFQDYLYTPFQSDDLPLLGWNLRRMVKDDHLREWALEAARVGSSAGFNAFTVRRDQAQEEEALTVPVAGVPGDSVRLHAWDLAGNEYATDPVSIPEIAMVKGFGPGLWASPCQPLIGPKMSLGAEGAPGKPLPAAPKLPYRVSKYRYATSSDGQRWGFCYDRGFHGFLVEHTIRERIVGASVAYRERAQAGDTDWVIDQTNVRITPHGLVTWDARTGPERLEQMEIRLLDASGRTFTAAVPGGDCRGQTPADATATICGQDGGEKVADVAGMETVLLGFQENDSDRGSLPLQTFTIRGRAIADAVVVPASVVSEQKDGDTVIGRTYALRIGTGSLPDCVYDLYDASVTPRAAFNVCGLWGAHVEYQGDRVLISLGESYRKAISEVEMIVSVDDRDLVASNVPAFDILSSPAVLDLGGAPMDVPLQVRARVHLADGSGVEEVPVLDLAQASAGNGAVCPTPLSLYRPSMQARVAISPVYGPVCSGRLPDYRITATAEDRVSAVTSMRVAVSRGGGQALPLTTAPFLSGSQVSTSATMVAEAYVDGTWMIEAEASDAYGRSVTSAPVSVLVSRSAPSLNVSSPTIGSAVCPMAARDSKGQAVRRVAVEGWVYGSIKDRSLLLRCGDEPVYQRFSAPAADGELGTIDVSTRRSSDCELRLEATTNAGVSYCTDPVSFHLVNAATVSVAVDPALISPNSDGQVDSAQLTLALDAPSDVTINATDATGRSGTVWSGNLPTGRSTVWWDGLIAGEAAADGAVALRVSAVDPCTNTATATASVPVDTTRPIVRIDAPIAGTRIGGLAMVSGEASDANFDQYELAIGAGPAPSSYSVVLSSYLPATGFLGAVSTVGLAAGTYTIRLWARDSAGNEDSAFTTIEVAPRQIINLFSASPALISPNGDGILDSANIHYQLLADAAVTLEVIDVGQSVVATLLAAEPAVVGDGQLTVTVSALAGLADGEYRVRLRAVTTNAEETETAPFALDRAAPAIEIENPVNGAVVAGRLDVAGSIRDPHLTSWRIGLAADSAEPLVVASGKSTRSDILVALRDLTDGDYRILADASDGAGNRSTTVERRFASDTTPPVVAFLSPEEGAFLSGSNGPIDVRGEVRDLHLASVTLESSSSGGSVREMFTGSALGVDGHVSSWDVHAEPDGPVELRLVAVDRAGNRADALRSVFVDSTPPVALIDAPREAYLRAGESITGTAFDDSLASWTLEMTSGPPAETSLWVPIATDTVPVIGPLVSLSSLPADGAYGLRLTVTDRAGNRSQDSTSFLVDTKPPQPPSGLVAVTEARDVILTWGASPDADVVGYRVLRAIGGSALAPVGDLVDGRSLRDQGLADGSYRYAVAAVDGAGLQSANSTEVSIKIDRTPPLAAIVRPASGASVSGSVQIVGTAWSADDFKEYRLSYGSGASPSSFTTSARSGVGVGSGVLGQLDVSALGQGSSWTIRLEVEDLSGNVAEARTTVVVDVVAPVAPVLVSAAPSGSSVAVAWTAGGEGDLAGFIVYRNGSVVNAPSGVTASNLTAYLLPSSAVSYVDGALGDGTYSYEVQSFDRAGNGSPLSNSLTVTVETRAPHAIITTPLALTRIDRSVPVVAETSDSDVAQVQFQVRDGASGTFQALGEPVTRAPYAALLDPSAYASPILELRAVATDRSGNVDPAPASVFVFYTASLMAPVAAARVDENRVDLSWTDPNPAGRVSGYAVTRDGTSLVGTPAVPTGTASASDTATAPGRALDGSTDTAWISRISGAQWWQLDLARPVMAREIDLTLTWSSQIEVLVDVRGVWVPVRTAVADGAVAISLEPGLEISGVRVRFLTAPAGAVGLYEASVAPVPLLLASPISDGPLAEGDYAYGVAAVSPFGARAEASVGSRIYAPVVDAVTPDVVTTPDLRLAGGSVIASAQVTILRGGEPVAETTAEADGSFAADVVLADGLNSFVAQAVDLAGNVSLPSSPVSVTWDAPPAAQVSLSLTGVTGSDVGLAFTVTGDTSRIAGFRLDRTNAGTSVAAATLGPTARNVIDANVSNGTYAYTVVAFNAHGAEGNRSNSVSATVSTDPLPAPVGLAVRPMPAGGSVRLSWAYAGSSASGFLVERAVAAPGPFSAVNIGNLSATTSYVDRGLTDSVLYFYRVRAVDGAGNVGVASEVASGAPHDTHAPGRPRITSPTDPNNPVEVYSTYTDVSGLSEPGSLVELRQNGTWIGVAPAGPMEWVSQWVDYLSSSSGFGVSSDERVLAIGRRIAGQERLDITESGVTVSILDPSITSYGQVVFSSDGTTLAFEAVSQQDGRSHVWVANRTDGSFHRVASSGVEERAPVWSSDGRRLAYEVQLASGSDRAIGLFDIASASETLLERTGADLSKPGWLADGTLLAIATPAAAGAPRAVASFTLGSGPGTDIYTSTATLSDLVLAPSGQYAALVISDGNEDLLLLDVAGGGGATRLTQDAIGDRAPAFAKGGRELVWVHGTTLASVDLQSFSMHEVGDIGPQDSLVGTDDGLFSYATDSDVMRHDWGGRFLFSRVLLESGENVFVATAETAAGNQSQASAPISVTLNPSYLPDLALEVAVQPAIPLAGLTTNAIVTVRNVGGARSSATSVQVSVLPSEGTVRQAGSVAIGALPPGSSTVALVPLDLSGLVGPQRLLAVLDPDGRVNDASRSNNQMMVTVYVARSLSVEIGVAVNPVEVAANHTATATVTLLNPGLQRDVTVRTRIADTVGTTVVEAADARYAPLAGGGMASFTRSLAIGSAWAGTYQVIAEAVVDGAVVASGATQLEVIPDRAIELSLVSQRASYLVGEEVTLHSTVTNQSLNSALEGASYRLEILDGLGNVVFAVPSRALPSLWTGALATESTQVSSSLIGVATFQARATVELGGAVLAQKTTSVVISGRPLLVGALSVVGADEDPPVVGVGGDARVECTIRNEGSAESSIAGARVVLIDPDSLAVVSIHAIGLTSLTGQDEYTGTVLVSTAGLPLKVYAVSLVADHDGQSGDVLATARFRVADATPPWLDVSNLNSGMYVGGIVSPIVRALDDSGGTTQVRVSVDGQGAIPLQLASGNALDGIWSGSISLGTDGLHTLVFSAADAEGNDGLTAVTPTNPVTIRVVSDTVPPVLSILGVSDLAIFATSVTPVVEGSDANLAQVTTLLNGVPFANGTPITADGDYLLAASAVDRAGNQTGRIVTFEVDATPPVVALSGFEDGGFVSTDVSPAYSVAEPHLDHVDAVLDQLPFVAGMIATSEGLHVLTVTAVDRAGNTTRRDGTFTIDRTAPIIALSGVVDGSYATSNMLPVFGASDVNLASVTAALDGVPFTSGGVVSSDGTHTLVVVASDRADNTASTSVTFVIDRTAPAINVAGVNDGEITNRDVKPVVTISDANLVTSAVTLDAQPFQAGTAVTTEGTHVLSAQGVDRAGNQSSTTVRFTVDKTPPTVTVDGIVDGASYTTAVMPTVTSSDLQLLRTDITLNGVPFSSGGTISQDGNYTLSVHAEDAAGNATDRSVSFAIVTSKFVIEPRSGGGFARVLALVRAGTCTPPPADYSRIEAFLQTALGGSDKILAVTASEDAFLEQLRSGFYSVYILASVPATSCGLDLCTEGFEGFDIGLLDLPSVVVRKTIVRELTELVHAGHAGVVAIRSRAGYAPKYRELLGADMGDYTGSGGFIAEGTPFTPMADLALGSRGVKLKLYGGGRVGRFSGSSCFGTTDVAAVHQTLGKGQSVTMGYDPSLASPGSGATQALQRVVDLVTPTDAAGPMAVVGVELGIGSGSRNASATVRSSVGSPATIVGAAPAATIDMSGSTAEWRLDLVAGETTGLWVFPRLPDVRSTTTLTTEVRSADTGTTASVTQTIDVMNARTGADLLADALALVVSLPKTLWDGPNLLVISTKLSAVRDLPVHSRSDVERNLTLLVCAAEISKDLKSESADAVRLSIDELIRYWEARWYVY